MQQTEKAKTLILKDRRELMLDGVKEVISFDENGAVVLTELGELCVEGVGIRLSNLDAAGGEVQITGRIDAMIYSEESADKKKGLKARLFG